MEGPPLGAAFLCRLSMSIVSGLTCERTMWLSGRYHPGQAPDNVRPDVLATTRARRPTMCASNPYPRELPKTQTTSPLAARFQHYSPRWSAMWAPHHRKPRPRHRQSGGNRTTRGSDTPSEGFVSCKTPPPPSWSGGHRRVRRVWRVLEGVAARKAWPRCRGRRRGPVQTNVARNFRRSSFETA